MKEKLIKKLINEDDGNIHTFFIEIGDYSFENISLEGLILLLEIENIKSRYEALEAITCKNIYKTNNNYLSFLLESFKNVTDPLIAGILNFTTIDESLLSSSETKFKSLVSTISKMQNSDVAHHISNIFCNKEILKLSDHDYIDLLNKYTYLKTEELSKIEDEIYTLTKKQ